MQPTNNHYRHFRIIIVALAMALIASSSGAKLETSPTAEKLVAAAGMVRLADIIPPADLDLPDLKGKRIRLSDYQGKVVVLNFWTTWCPPCKEETVAFEKLHRKFEPDNFALVTVNWKESPQKVRRFMDRNNLTFPVVTDGKGEMSKHFKVRSLPTTYLLNKQGTLIGLAIGPRDWNGKAFNTLIAHLIKTS